VRLRSGGGLDLTAEGLLRQMKGGDESGEEVDRAEEEEGGAIEGGDLIPRGGDFVDATLQNELGNGGGGVFGKNANA
jgi:hypothetical protein